jgi:hypothetical protein
MRLQGQSTETRTDLRDGQASKSSPIDDGDVIGPEVNTAGIAADRFRVPRAKEGSTCDNE